jgi:hypothetical protein
MVHSLYPRDQVLILADTDLKHHPAEAMNRVFAHVGLVPFDVGHLSAEDLEAKYAVGCDDAMSCRGRVRRILPWSASSLTMKYIISAFSLRRRAVWETFDATGWQLHGDYAPLSTGLRQKLATFFAPHNARLYAYLGRDFGWDGGLPRLPA